MTSRLIWICKPCQKRHGIRIRELYTAVPRRVKCHQCNQEAVCDMVPAHEIEAARERYKQEQAV